MMRASLLLLYLVLTGTVETHAETLPEVSFSRDVMAVLSRAGCNMGACHGNASGKGGFRLSLRGQDQDFDHYWLTREANGRRVDRLNPQISLLLQKPAGQMAHQGGVRFAEDSPEYQLLQAWIARGTPGPSHEAALTTLMVTPREAIVNEPEDRVQIHVVARFADGEERDVTQLATYELSNLLAAIDTRGLVTRITPGEVTVIVRYLHLQQPVRLAFVPERSEFEWSAPASNNFIDDLVFNRLRQLRVNPSDPVDDYQFVRRAYLDAIGLLPTADEARRFVADDGPDKRLRWIRELVYRAEFAEHWALKWSDILRNEEKVLDAKGVEVFHAWIRDSIAADKPVDVFVRELMRAQGSSYEQPATNFWRANRDPATRAETTARLFLGVRLQCAKCHNHPFDRWTQDDYYSWAAVFARVDYKIIENNRSDKLDNNEFIGEQVILISATGNVKDPRTGQPVWPKLLGDHELGPGSYHDRLTPLAVWLTAPENAMFARAQVNFVWYHLMGRGIVDPIDDLRPTNPPSHPDLLAKLAEDFVAHGYSLRQLVELIMTSQTYQLSPIPNATHTDQEGNFARAIVYRLPAEKLLDAQSQVLDTPVEFSGHQRGLRAGQLPGVQRVRSRKSSAAAGDRFLNMFGKPERLLACECERSNETTLSQAFMLIGGELNERLEQSNNRLARLLESSPSDSEIIDQLYWTALSRPPSDTELTSAVAYLADADESSESSESPTAEVRFVRLQDLAWALLNSKEFIFRH